MSRVHQRIRQSRALRSLKLRENATARKGWVWFRTRFRTATHQTLHGHLARRRAFRRYIAIQRSPRLQVGAGPNWIEGWFNTDILSGDAYLDITRKLPFRDSTFAYVFGEHVIEHVPLPIGMALLSEIRRVLKPGGVLRLTTPDLPKIIALYQDRNDAISLAEYTKWMDEITPHVHTTSCQVFNSFMHEWGHQYVYDEQDLTGRLFDAGFDSVVRRDPGESDHPLLRGIERHGPDWENWAEAMCLEATAGKG